MSAAHHSLFEEEEEDKTQKRSQAPLREQQKKQASGCCGNCRGPSDDVYHTSFRSPPSRYYSASASASGAMIKTLNFKLVLLGNAAVGKSSCVERFVKNEFYEHQQPTIGAAFLTQTVQLDDHQVKFEIWDTAGQERYRSLAPMYYRGAAAALVVYDVTDHESFSGAKTWIEELQRQGSPDIVIGLAGNKVDMSGRRKVSTEEAKSYADENACVFFETSAKTGQNITEIFRAIAQKLPKHAHDVPNDAIHIVQPDENRKAGCCK